VAVAEGKFVVTETLAWLTGFKDDGPQSWRRSLRLSTHLRLVVGLRSGQTRINIQIFCPRVVAAKFQPTADTVRYIRLQRVVTAVAFREPEESSREKTVRPFCPRAGIYRVPCGTVGGTLLKLASVAVPPDWQVG